MAARADALRHVARSDQRGAKLLEYRSRNVRPQSPINRGHDAGGAQSASMAVSPWVTIRGIATKLVQSARRRASASGPGPSTVRDLVIRFRSGDNQP